MELLLIEKPPDRRPEVMGPPAKGKPAEPPPKKMLFALPWGIGPAEDDIGGGPGVLVVVHDDISATTNETEQTAIERRSWAGFINAEISAFGILAR
jgi:hypothetical protein